MIETNNFTGARQGLISPASTAEQRLRAPVSVDYHYCPECGFRMLHIEYMSIIADVPCPGRGGKPCGRPISRFNTAYKTSNAQISGGTPSAESDCSAICYWCAIDGHRGDEFEENKPLSYAACSRCGHTVPCAMLPNTVLCVKGEK